MSDSSTPGINARTAVPTLLVSVFIISICSILYELLISSVSSYFMGSAVLHFSIVIGLFLSSMGVGSYLSRFLQRHLLDWFIGVESLLSLIGGLSCIVLYFAFSLTPYFYLVGFLLILTLGILIGVEIPILTRVMRRYDNLRDALANILSFDYLGALIASILFPLLLLPTLGSMRTAFAVGLLNLLVAVANTQLFRAQLQHATTYLVAQAIIGAVLLSGFVYSFQIIGFFETQLYRDEIVLSRQTPYQQIVVTRYNQDVRLFINGGLQFSTRDEYRYHEPLVHVPAALAAKREHILVLGGGDGLAVRELLRYPDVGRIEVVDLDPEITNLARRNPLFRQVNADAMLDERVTIHNTDAFKFVEQSSDIYDLILVDLPDPNGTALGKLYSVSFYKMLRRRLAAGGAMVTQSTSPYFAPKAYWSIHRTMEQAFDTVVPYTSYVPSFGQWGFNMAFGSERVEFSVPRLASELFEQRSFDFRYLNREMLPGLFLFGQDIAEPADVEVNRLDNQILLQYYDQGWR